MPYRRTNRREMLSALGAVWASSLLSRIASAATSKDTHVTALLEEYVTRKKVAGVVAVVGTRGGPRFFSSGHIAYGGGAASAGPDSLWRIYSMTKMVTGAAAMLLIESGELALDMPVAEIFPTFGSSEVLDRFPGSSQTHRAKSPITIRHLMTHTSGLVGSLVPEPPLSTVYVDRKLNVSRVSLEVDARVQHQTSLLAFSAAAGTVPLAFDPGTRWSYGISSDVLGGVVERVAGIPFEKFLQQRIFDPLRMSDTGFSVSATDLARFATNYEVSSTGLEVVDAPPQSIFAKPPPFPFPSSGLVSSAHDFARFTGMMLGEGTLEGTRVLAPQTARLMMSNLLPAGVTENGQGWGAGGQVMLTSSGAATALGKTSGTYGWAGSSGTVAWIDRANGLYAVLMAQYQPSDAYGLQSDFTRAIFADASV